MKKLFRVIDAINDYLGRALSYFNIMVVGMVCWEIVARYVFNAPTIWASEGMVMLSGFMYVLVGGYAQLHKRHVRIDLLYSNLGLRGQAICDVISFLFFSLFMYALVWHGGIFALDSIKLRETSATPWDPIVYPIKSAIPVGAFLVWLQMTADVARKAYLAVTGKEL
jgi:TRAP-type mannitol/chloroaromatic compound transport system permease small subunit